MNRFKEGGFFKNEKINETNVVFPYSIKFIILFCLGKSFVFKIKRERFYCILSSNFFFVRFELIFLLLDLKNQLNSKSISKYGLFAMDSICTSFLLHLGHTSHFLWKYVDDNLFIQIFKERTSNERVWIEMHIKTLFPTIFRSSFVWI